MNPADRFAKGLGCVHAAPFNLAIPVLFSFLVLTFIISYTASVLADMLCPSTYLCGEKFQLKTGLLDVCVFSI